MLTPEKVNRIKKVISEPGYYARRYWSLMFLATHSVADDVFDTFGRVVYYDPKLVRRAEWYKHKFDTTMCTTKAIVCDYSTLKAGLYLSETRFLSPFTRIKVWSLQFVAPSDKTPLPAAVVHTIQHLFVPKLEEFLGKKFIGFYPCGCKTKFTLITKGSVKREVLVKTLIEIIEHTVPILSKEEIPALNEHECGNPNLFSVKETNTALSHYLEVL